jgi:signal transduction histidine kinase/ActR/RegA family two-component response regulator
VSRPAAGRARLRRRIVAVGAALIAAFAASSAYDVWRARAESVAATNRELTTLSRALAEEAGRVFQSVDLLLRDSADWYSAAGERLGAEEAREALATLAAGLPHVLSLAAEDDQGVKRYEWIADEAAHVPEAAQYVMARTVERSGRDAGRVLARVDLADFEEFYQAIDAGAGNSIVLLRNDGMLAARHPPLASSIGRRFEDLTAESEAASQAGEGGLVISPIDHARRFVAASPVREQPFVVMVTREERVALAPWREQSTHVAVRTLLLCLVGIALIALLARQLERADAAEADKDRLQAQLRQSQKMEAMGTLAGGIAHDFNNILGAILGYSELAQKNAPPAGPVRRHLEQVLQAARRAKSLVERILAFSRSGLGERAPLHVQSLIEETLGLLAASLPPRIRLEKRLAADDCAVIGDATQLHQVTMNLCTNAVQAMAQGGTLSVTLERVEVTAMRALSHGTLRPGPYVCLCVGDTGAGIPPHVLERMFDPFFTTKGVGEGTGLGLSLVHGIVADLGGAIDVSTHAGAGSTFAIWLPSAGTTPRPAPRVARELPHGQGQTVMVVDDEPALVGFLEETLGELGYEPAGFVASAAALEALADEPQRFDLVLTDETMPDITGVELARQIRRVRPDLPVILMSGHSSAALAERAHAEGVAAVLRKPLAGADIAEALERALRKQGQTAVS